MKRLFLLAAVVALFSMSAAAQTERHSLRGKDFRTGQLTRAEKFQLHKNDYRYQKAKRSFKRDGRVTPMEKRKLHKMRKHDRRQTFRFKHNRHHRVI